MSTARIIALLIICAGTLLAAITAVNPQLTPGAYKLDADVLAWAMLPYVAYGVYMAVADNIVKVVLPGVIIIAADVYLHMRYGFAIKSVVANAGILYGPPLMILVGLPVGWFIGKILGGRPVEPAQGDHNATLHHAGS